MQAGDMSILAPPSFVTLPEYHRMIAVGILCKRDHLELLEGEIIPLSPIGYRHHQAVTNLLAEFGEQARRRYLVAAQGPIWLDDQSEPEPDIVLIARSQRTAGHHAKPAAIFLVIEVADTSLAYDRGRKMRAYARNGISEFWILDLSKDVLEVFREPAGESYDKKVRIGLGGTASPLAFPDVQIVLAEVIPARFEE